MTATANDLKIVLTGITCDKMLRAWRNRSNVTRWKWEAAAGVLFGIRRHGGSLYAACAELTDTPWVFDGATFRYWDALAAKLPAMIEFPTEQALSRGEYDRLRNDFGQF